MAYYQFDLNLINLAALPSGANSYSVRLIFSGSNESPARYFDEPFPASQSITVDTRDAEPGSSFPPPPFELSATDDMWVDIEAVNINGSDYLAQMKYTLGPYTVGDVGTEVPPT